MTNSSNNSGLTARKRHKHRRVTAYSRIDSERINHGQEPLLTEPGISDDETDSFEANDARLIQDVPPHYGA